MKKLILLIAILIYSLFVTNANALTQVITASVHFVTPITITNVVNADFGNVRTGTNASYTIDTSGSVTTTSGLVLSGTKSASSMLIKGSGTQTINISVGTYVANGGVTPSAATCKYGTGTAAPCTDSAFANSPAPTATGTPLLLGLTIDADGSQTDNATAVPTFIVTVIYN